MRAGDTIVVRGEGGAIDRVDVPANGTNRREVFDEMIHKGQLVPLDDGDYREVDDGESVKLVTTHVGEGPAEDADEDDDRPPLTGKGSGRGAWADYAATLGVEVTDEMTRDDVVAAVVAAEDAV